MTRISAPIILLSAAGLLGCTSQARIYPMDDAALKAGAPKIEFTQYGLGRGPVTITMPDGEILKGEFQVTDSATIGTGVVGLTSVTAMSSGPSAVVLAATGDRGTIINCEGTTDIMGHGSGICSTNKGRKYRVMF